MDISESLLRGRRLDIEINQAPVTPNKPQRVKLYNMTMLAKTIQMWLILAISLFHMLTYLI